jgi:hypothetical protein
MTGMAVPPVCSDQLSAIATGLHSFLAHPVGRRRCGPGPRGETGGFAPALTPQNLL